MARERGRTFPTGEAEREATALALEELALRCLGLLEEAEVPEPGEGPVLRLEELVADESGAIVFETSGVATLYLETSVPVPSHGSEGGNPPGEAAGSHNCLVLGGSTVLYFPPDLEVRIVTASE